MSPTREKFPLSLKKITKKTLLASIFGFFVSDFVFIPASFFIIAGIFGFDAFNTRAGEMFFYTGVLWLALYIGLIFLIRYYQKWYFSVYYYEITEEFIVIKKGPITPHEITIPFARVQDVYVDQDLFDRMFGLYDVHLASATGASGAEAHIDGLEKAAADGIKEVLLAIIHKKISGNKN